VLVEGRLEELGEELDSLEEDYRAKRVRERAARAISQAGQRESV
jgi:hypothetical protein